MHATRRHANRADRRLSPARRAAAMSAALVALAVAAPKVAHAFSITTASSSSKNVKQYKQTKVYYFLHPDGSDNMPKATALDELRKGFEGWMDVKCGQLTFTEGYHCNTALGKCLYDKGKTCKADTDCPAAYNKKLMPIGYKNNGRNELVFVENNAWSFGSYVLGVTVALHNYKGAIVESDIAFNGYQQNWVTDAYKAGKGKSHLLSVAIHEQGHFFGVMHNLGGWPSNDPPTMAPNVQPYGWSASLNFDDEKAICFLNPKNGSYACKNDGDCPYVVHKSNGGKEAYTAKYTCSSGKCVWGPLKTAGTKTLGDTCTGASDCKSPYYCQVVGGQSFCVQGCNPQQKNCPSGFLCYGYQSQPTKGACLKDPGGGSATKKSLGESCDKSNECASLLCLQGTCQTPCTPGNAGDCASGLECQTLPGGNGVCVKPTGPVLKKVGEECQDPAECATGVCMKADLQATVGICRAKCTTAGDCDKDFKCVSQGEGYQGCLPGKENIASGGLCKFDEQCAGGKCILAGDAGKVCSQSCTLGEPTSCPCGMACQNTSSGAACFPSKPVGCVAGGEPCGGDSECASSVCGNGTCRVACDIAAAEQPCGDNEGCLRLAKGGTKGYCTTRGTVPNGKFCLGDDLCLSLFCDKDVTKNNEPRCGVPCNPAASACPAGQKCNPLSSTYGACYVPAGAADAGGTGGDASGVDVVGGNGLVPVQGGGTRSGGCSAAPADRRAPSGGSAGLTWALLLAGAALWLRRRAA